MPNKKQRPSLDLNVQLFPPTTHSQNGLKILESESALGNNTPRLFENRDDHHSQNPTRGHRRDPGPPRHRFRGYDPPSMRSRIQIMGPIVSPTPLLHHPPHPKGHDLMVQDIPSAGGEPRSPRQGPTLLNGRTCQFSRGVFRTHPVVHERGEGDFDGTWNV